MLFAELAVLAKLDSVGVVLLVLHIVVIALLALGACQSNTRSHNPLSPFISAREALGRPAL